MIKVFQCDDYTIEVYQIKGGQVMLQIQWGDIPYNTVPGAAAVIRLTSIKQIELLQEAIQAYYAVQKKLEEIRQTKQI